MEVACLKSQNIPIQLSDDKMFNNKHIIWSIKPYRHVKIISNKNDDRIY